MAIHFHIGRSLVRILSSKPLIFRNWYLLSVLISLLLLRSYSSWLVLIVLLLLLLYWRSRWIWSLLLESWPFIWLTLTLWLKRDFPFYSRLIRNLTNARTLNICHHLTRLITKQIELVPGPEIRDIGNKPHFLSHCLFFHIFLKLLCSTLLHCRR